MADEACPVSQAPAAHLYSLLRRNSRMEMDAAAPSPTADATCFVLP